MTRDVNWDDLQPIPIYEAYGFQGWPIGPPDIGAIINRRLVDSLDRRMTEAVFGARWRGVDPNPFPLLSVSPFGARIDNAILHARRRVLFLRSEARWRLRGAWSHLRDGGCDQ